MTETNEPEPSRVLAQIDLTKSKIGWMYHQDSPISKEMETTVFSAWQNPLYNKKWRKYSCWTIHADEGQNILEFVAGEDGLITTKESDWTDYQVHAKIRFLSRFAIPTPGNGRSTGSLTGLIF